jgi:hypothetical protein
VVCSPEGLLDDSRAVVHQHLPGEILLAASGQAWSWQEKPLAFLGRQCAGHNGVAITHSRYDLHCMVDQPLGVREDKPQPRRVIPGGRDHRAPIGAEGRLPHPVLVASEGGPRLTAGGISQPRRIIPGGRQHRAPIGAEGCLHHPLMVAGEDPLFS